MASRHSHAPARGLGGSISTSLRAIVLAGGKGERLRPYTNDRPKAMIEVCGRPILGHQLDWLRRHGVGEVVISCGYRHEVIERFAGFGEAWGIRVRYACEDEPLGRGGGIKRALGLLLEGGDSGEAVIALNGDVLTAVDLGDLIAAHRQLGALATVVLTPLVSPYGIVEVGPDDRISAFREKPRLPHWINAGIYALSPDIHPLLPDRGDHETATFPQLAAQGRLAAYRTEAYWRGIDTAKDITEAEEEIRCGKMSGG